MTRLDRLTDQIRGQAGAFTAATGIALCVLTVGLWWLGGLAGAGVGLLIASLWFVLPATYLVAAGHLGVLLVTPASLAIGELLLIEAGFIGVLVDTADGRDSLVALVGWTVVIGASLGGVGVLLLDRTRSLWLTAVVLAGLVAFTMYAIHRVELIRLDRVEGVVTREFTRE